MTDSSLVAVNRFTLRRIAADDSSFAADVASGLSSVRKSIPPRYFYDDLGSALFEAICELPEYYVGRAETEILKGSRREIASSLGGVARVIELGSGNGRKTRLLLAELMGGGRELEYVPVDVDASMLQKLGRDLLAGHETLTVTALASDFSRAARVLRDLPPVPTSLFFLGSTIGNLDPNEAAAMLRDMKTALRPGDTFLLGADLKKGKAILEAAYDDPLRVTAAFNLNLLKRINRELGGEFDIRRFAHRAFYDEELGRIEMHLVSLREQSVPIGALGIEIAFAEGETIHTENSYKYDDARIEEIARAAGYELVKKWTDSKGLFADYLLAVSG